MNPASPEGYRDLCLLLVFIDTAARSSEVTGMQLADVDLEGGCIKLLGKGNKERVVPIGSEVKRHLWRYVNLHRPQTASQLEDYHRYCSSYCRPSTTQAHFAILKYSCVSRISCLLS